MCRWLYRFPYSFSSCVTSCSSYGLRRGVAEMKEVRHKTKGSDIISLSSSFHPTGGSDPVGRRWKERDTQFTSYFRHSLYFIYLSVTCGPRRVGKVVSDGNIEWWCDERRPSYAVSLRSSVRICREASLISRSTSSHSVVSLSLVA